MNNKIPFELIFDNSGGITLQTEKYCHHFRDRESELAQCVVELMDGGSTDHWDGNDPEVRWVYDFDLERTGGCYWEDSIDIAKHLTLPFDARELWFEDISDFARCKFYKSLFKLCDVKQLATDQDACDETN